MDKYNEMLYKATLFSTSEANSEQWCLNIDNTGEAKQSPN